MSTTTTLQMKHCTYCKALTFVCQLDGLCGCGSEYSEHALTDSYTSEDPYCGYCGTFGHLPADCPEQEVPTYYAVGHNVSGYLPECDVYVTDSFEEAKRYLIHDLLFAADYAETDDIGNALALAAEDVNLWNGCDVVYVEMIDSEHCIPTAYWIVETDETPEDAS